MSDLKVKASLGFLYGLIHSFCSTLHVLLFIWGLNLDLQDHPERPRHPQSWNCGMYPSTTKLTPITSYLDLFSFLFSFYRFLCSSGWLWTYLVTKDDFELLTLLLPPPLCWGCTVHRSWVAGNGSQDFVHASQEFYQLNCIPASLGLLV